MIETPKHTPIYLLEVNGNNRSFVAERLLREHGIKPAIIERPSDHGEGESGSYPFLTIEHPDGSTTHLSSIYQIIDLFPEETDHGR